MSWFCLFFFAALKPVSQKWFSEISERNVWTRRNHCELLVPLAPSHSASQWAGLHFNEGPFSTSHNQWACWLCGSGLWAVTGQGRWFCLISSPAATASAPCFFNHMPLSLSFLSRAPNASKYLFKCPLKRLQKWQRSPTTGRQQWFRHSVDCPQP